MKKTFLLTLFFVLMPYGLEAGTWLHQCPLSIDRWYRVEPDWLIQAPDKFQHAFFSMVGQMLGQEIIGETKTFALIGIVGAFKEFCYDDEGYSLRDLGCNLWGCLAGILVSQNSWIYLFPAWQKDEILFCVKIGLA